MYNVGGIDKFLRIAIGGILLVIALVGDHFFGQEILWVGVGVVSLMTGMTSFCPTYTIFGFTTCPPGGDT